MLSTMNRNLFRHRFAIILVMSMSMHLSDASASIIKGNFSGQVVARMGNAISNGSRVDGDFSYFVEDAIPAGNGIHLLNEAVSSLSIRVGSNHFDYTFKKEADIGILKDLINGGINQVKNLLNSSIPNITDGIIDGVGDLAKKAAETTGKLVTISDPFNSNLFALGGFEITDSQNIFITKIPTAAQLLGIAAIIPGLQPGELPTNASGPHLGVGFAATGAGKLENGKPKLELSGIGFTINELNIGDLATVPLPTSLILTMSGTVALFGFARRRRTATPLLEAESN